MAEKQVKKTAKRKTGKKREKVNIPSGVAHILATFNNTIISITDLEGNLLATSSAGAVGFKGSRKGRPMRRNRPRRSPREPSRNTACARCRFISRGPVRVVSLQFGRSREPVWK